eukprot:TRINITY_DN1580_c0_g1_i2.p2 TRINITY_DN1580_c0_g1~~TRINITY_DN1580_c0_g1_i2.p2  ORF type:complete len:151 (+),score=14.89 TRINITY_DN1580_c0_g1_i2:344-796(+)
MPVFTYSSAPQKEVDRIQFGVLSPDEVRASSVAEIKFAETVRNGEPVENGLADRRLGTSDHQYRCASCAGDMKECPGHFGHLELARPVYHVGFRNTVLQVLRCVCFRCSKLLPDPVCRVGPLFTPRLTFTPILVPSSCHTLAGYIHPFFH